MPMGHMHHHGMDMQGMEGMDMQGMHAADAQTAPHAGPACMAGMDMDPCNSSASEPTRERGARPMRTEVLRALALLLAAGRGPLRDS